MVKDTDNTTEFPLTRRLVVEISVKLLNVSNPLVEFKTREKSSEEFVQCNGPSFDLNVFLFFFSVNFVVPSVSTLADFWVIPLQVLCTATGTSTGTSSTSQSPLLPPFFNNDNDVVEG